MDGNPKDFREAYNEMVSKMGQDDEGQDNMFQDTVPDDSIPSDSQPQDGTQPIEGDPIDAPPVEPNAEPPVEPVQQGQAIDPYSVVDRQAEALKNATIAYQQAQAENAQLKALMQEQNTAARETVMDDAMTPPVPTMPQMPDFAELAYMSEEEKNRVMSEFTNGLMDSVKNDVLTTVQPFIEKARQAEQLEMENAIIAQMSDPASDLPDFDKLLPQMKQIIQNNPLLSSAENPEEKWINAYVMAVGSNAIDQPKKDKLSDDEKSLLTNDDFIDMYRKNKDLQRLVAQDTLQAANEGQAIPTFSAGGDAGNVALNIQEKPKDFDQAKAGMFSLFKRRQQ